MRERTFRTATEDDLERIIEIHTAAYPDARTALERRRNFTENALGSIDDLMLCVEGERVVGHAFLFSLRVFVRGAAQPAGGIASIGVAPEARGRKVASELLEHMHALSRARGDLFTLLYPFRQGFYARHGYAPVTPSERVYFSPRAVPRRWRADVWRAGPGECEALWSEVARASTGMLDRPRALWDRKQTDDRRNTLVTEGGYVAFEVKPQRVIVHELVARTDAAARALAGAIGAMADQASLAELPLPRGSALALALGDGEGALPVEDAIGAMVAGPMLRLTDVDRARALFPKSSGLETDPQTLGVVLFGGWRARDAIALGLAEGACALPDAPPYFSPDSF